MIEFQILNLSYPQEAIGWIPHMLSEANPKSAVEQLNDGYQHGGGWRPFNGFTLTDGNLLLYPGDPPVNPIAQTQLRDELIIVYEHSWVAVIQKDRSFEVCRMD